MTIEKLNEQLKLQFHKDRNYLALEKYVMSELLSPIEDYYNAINIVRENLSLIDNLNLYYVATYISLEWLPETDEFIDIIKDMIDIVDDYDKAIIYYLIARSVSCSKADCKKFEEYKYNLEKSIEYSSGINFVNNRIDYSNILQGEEAQKYFNMALKNIIEIETKDTLRNKSIDYWLSSQRFIDEFILGTHLSEEVYLFKFGNRKIGWSLKNDTPKS